MTPVVPTPKAIRTAHWRPHLPTQDGTFGCHFAGSQNGRAKVQGPSAPALRELSSRRLTGGICHQTI